MQIARRDPAKVAPGVAVEIVPEISLGACYQNGEGVPKDDTEAVKWYRKAAEQGNATAQYNLGSCYDFGEGVAKDDVIAYMWYNLAAASGYGDAKRNRDFLEKKMTAEKIARGATSESRMEAWGGVGAGCAFVCWGYIVTLAGVLIPSRPHFHYIITEV